MKVCYMCMEHLSDKDMNHIYHCAKINNIALSKKDIKFNQISFISDVIWTKDILVELYLDQGYSLPEFRENFGLSFSQTIFLLNYFNIRLRNSSEAMKSNNRIQKYQQTCVKKYGETNVSKVDSIKEKKKETFIKNYGVDNIRKSKEFTQWLQNYMLEKYGQKSITAKQLNRHAHLSAEHKAEINTKKCAGYKKWWYSLSDEEKTKQIQNRGHNGWDSKLETRVGNILSANNIGYKTQFFISRRSFDFRLNNTKILIEVNGDLWHANPECYKANDILPFVIKGQNIASGIWEYDIMKKNLAENKGYAIVYIWEKQMKNMSDTEVFDFLMSEIENVGTNQINQKSQSSAKTI